MRGWTTMAVAAATALLGGCGAMHGHGGMHGSGPMAHAALQPTQGNTAKGMAMFHTSANGVILHARVSGLKPNQEHGFHIHEKGDCSAPDGARSTEHGARGTEHGARAVVLDKAKVQGWLATDPMFDSIKADTEFEALF